MAPSTPHAALKTVTEFDNDSIPALASLSLRVISEAMVPDMSSPHASGQHSGSFTRVIAENTLLYNPGGSASTPSRGLIRSMSCKGWRGAKVGGVPDEAKASDGGLPGFRMTVGGHGVHIGC